VHKKCELEAQDIIGNCPRSQKPTSVVFPRQPEVFDASEGVEDVSIGEVNERVLRLGDENFLVTVGSLTVLLKPAKWCLGNGVR
jgi:hypothetical protein